MILTQRTLEKRQERRARTNALKSMFVSRTLGGTLRPGNFCYKGVHGYKLILAQTLTRTDAGGEFIVSFYTKSGPNSRQSSGDDFPGGGASESDNDVISNADRSEVI